MLDTVVLVLNSNEFTVVNPGRFTPSACMLTFVSKMALGAKGVMSCFQNSTKEEIRRGVYKPKLTLIQRPGNLVLKIEFSAPKLLFGNNFEELQDRDFSEVLNLLKNQLFEMGITVDLRALENANVSALHFSKNIILDRYLTSSMLVSELMKVDLNKWLDLNLTEYRNGGHVVRYHANSYELVFYDKIKDLKQSTISDQRAIENHNSMQVHMLKKLEDCLEIFRMELRLLKRRKIKSVLKEVGLDIEMNFSSLFNAEISHRVLSYFSKKILSSLDMLSMIHSMPEDLYQALHVMSGGRIKPPKILQMVGALMLADSVGVRRVRALLGIKSDRCWQSIKKELLELDLPKNTKFRVINQLKRGIEEFTPVKAMNLELLAEAESYEATRN